MSETDKRQRILNAATKLFSSQGLKNTNIRQIADMAKANSALIFYYFGCKEHLFYGCLAEMATERLTVSQEILRSPQDRRDFEIKLELFVKNMLTVINEKKDLLKILHREIDSGNKKAAKIFQDYFVPVVETLHQFFQAAHKSKILREDINPLHLTLDFFALLSNHARNEALVDIILKEKKSQISSYVDHVSKRIMGLVLKGVV